MSAVRAARHLGFRPALTGAYLGPAIKDFGYREVSVRGLRHMGRAAGAPTSIR